MNKSFRYKIIIAIIAVLTFLGFSNSDIFYTNNSDYQYTKNNYVDYHFRNDELLIKHFESHGIEMGFLNKEDYEKAASDVINSDNALYKKESEDNDDVYYLEDSNEIVFVSSDGYIRTYFNPDDGKDYFDRQ